MTLSKICRCLSKQRTCNLQVLEFLTASYVGGENMGEEYVQWLNKHPNATEEEKREAWNKYLMMLEARNYIINMFLAYRR